MDRGIERQTGNKFRRSLKEVQLSADERKVSVSSMMYTDDKTSLKLKQPKTVEKVIVAEKENASAVRRSKRKTPAATVKYLESPLELKPSKPKNTQTKKTISKPKKSRSTTAKKNEQKTTLNQTKLDFPPLTTDTIKENSCAYPQPDDENIEKKSTTASTENNEDSGFDPTCGISIQSPMNSTAILRPSDVKESPSIPYNMLSAITAENPPLNYWKDLAEQRRIALEKALHENELLHDQLAVLEAENSQLKQLLKEAENLAQVVRDIID